MSLKFSRSPVVLLLVCVCVCAYMCVCICVVCVCSALRCIPDIWSLLEWSDWLTPRNLHVRYDTLFYMCFIDTQPPVTGDGEEIVDAKVDSCVYKINTFHTTDILICVLSINA